MASFLYRLETRCAQLLASSTSRTRPTLPIYQSMTMTTTTTMSCPYSTTQEAPSAAISTPFLTSCNSMEQAVTPKIAELVLKISELSLIETMQLVSQLKVKLNITDLSMFPSPGLPYGAQAVPSGQGMASGVAASDVGAKKDDVVKAEEQTEFKVTLVKFDPTAKAKIIREIKAVLNNLNLVEVSVAMLFFLLLI